MAPRLNDDDLREIRAKLHALETQVVLLTAGVTDLKEQATENAKGIRAGADQILVIKTRIALVSSAIGAAAAIAAKYLLH